MDSVTLQDSITHSLAAANRIVLLVGPPGCGKSRLLRDFRDVGIVDVGQELARELIPLADENRREMAADILKQLIDVHPYPVVILDNIELLLRPELNLDLWSVLEYSSGEKKLIVAWTGHVAGDEIQWGHPGVPGHRVLSMEKCPASVISITG